MSMDIIQTEIIKLFEIFFCKGSRKLINLLMIFYILWRFELTEDHSITNIIVILITSFIFFNMSCKVRVDKTHRGIVEIKSDRNTAFVTL